MGTFYYIFILLIAKPSPTSNISVSRFGFSEFLADDGKIDTIERDEERIKEAKENFKKVGVEEKFIFMKVTQ